TNYPRVCKFTLPIFGPHMLCSEYHTRYSQREIRGIGRIDGDKIAYIHTDITPAGDEETVKDFYAEMEGKPDDQTALHLATMNYLRYDLKGDMSNVVIVDNPIPAHNQFSL